MPKGALLLAFVLGATALSAPARADEPGAEDDLKRGVALRREGKDAEALQMFERALARSPSPRARAQVALAEQALALWLLSERDLKLALAETDDPWIKQNRDALERASRVVAGKLAWIAVESGPGAEVLVNGAPATVARDGRIRVVAGQVGVEVRADGHAPANRTVQVAPETTMKIALAIGPPLPARPKDVAVAPRPAPPPPAPPPPADSGLRTVGWVLTGAGVVTLGIGGFFGVRAIGKKSDRDSDCQNGCTQTGVEADRDGRSAALVSTVTLLAGAAVTTTGLVLVLTSSPAPVTVGITGTSFDLRGTF